MLLMARRGFDEEMTDSSAAAPPKRTCETEPCGDYFELFLVYWFIPVGLLLREPLPAEPDVVDELLAEGLFAREVDFSDSLLRLVDERVADLLFDSFMMLVFCLLN